MLLTLSLLLLVLLSLLFFFPGRQRVLRMKDQGVGSPHLLHTFSPQPASRPLFAVFGRIWRSLVATWIHRSLGNLVLTSIMELCRLLLFGISLDRCCFSKKSQAAAVNYNACFCFLYLPSSQKTLGTEFHTGLFQRKPRDAKSFSCWVLIFNACNRLVLWGCKMETQAVRTSASFFHPVAGVQVNKGSLSSLFT